MAEAQSAVTVDQLGLVEGFILVKAQTVKSADLVGMLVVFGLPRSAVPVLTIAGVPGGELVTDMLNFQNLSVVELHGSSAAAPVRICEGLGSEVAGTEGSGAVVYWLVVGSGPHHS